MPLPKFATLPVELMPVWVAQRASRLALYLVLARHPTLFDRLGEYAAKRYLFTPTDLPLAFEIVPADKSIRVYRNGADATGDAVISGPIVTLLALAEGRVDGDALFFSRELEISGDTEAVLALRNALDDSALDLPRDLAPAAGPLHGPVQWALVRLRTWLLSERMAKWS
jgi:O2-independent ubiquinone biosynthesis accessory factor UbiT